MEIKLNRIDTAHKSCQGKTKEPKMRSFVMVDWCEINEHFIINVEQIVSLEQKNKIIANEDDESIDPSYWEIKFTNGDKINVTFDQYQEIIDGSTTSKDFNSKREDEDASFE